MASVNPDFLPNIIAAAASDKLIQRSQPRLPRMLPPCDVQSIAHIAVFAAPLALLLTVLLQHFYVRLASSVVRPSACSSLALRRPGHSTTSTLAQRPSPHSRSHITALSPSFILLTTYSLHLSGCSVLSPCSSACPTSSCELHSTAIGACDSECRPFFFARIHLIFDRPSHLVKRPSHLFTPTQHRPSRAVLAACRRSDCPQHVAEWPGKPRGCASFGFRHC